MGPEDIELGEPVKVKTKRPSGVVVSFRIPPEIADSLTKIALRDDLHTSQLVRRALREYIQKNG